MAWKGASLQTPRFKLKPQFKFGLREWSTNKTSVTHRGYTYDIGFLSIQLVIIREIEFDHER